MKAYEIWSLINHREDQIASEMLTACKVKNHKRYIFILGTEMHFLQELISFYKNLPDSALEGDLPIFEGMITKAEAQLECSSLEDRPSA